MTKTIFELLEEKQAAESKLYQECFELGRYAGEIVEDSKYASIRQNLGDGTANKARAGDMFDAALLRRDELKDEALIVNSVFDEQKQARQESLEKSLDPDAVETSSLLQVSMASAEQLINLVDLALSTGDEDAVLLALRVARQRDLEDVESHIRTVRLDLNEICAELDVIEEIPDYDPSDAEERFDSIAPGVPSREDLLNLIV